MPVLGAVENPLEDHNDTRSAKDETRVGHYKEYLGSGTTLEMSATHRAGLYSYTFPQDSTCSNVIVDVSHVLPSFRGQGLGQSYLGGNISVTEDPQSGSLRYEGFGSYDNVSIPLDLPKKTAAMIQVMLTYPCYRVGTARQNGLSTSVGISTKRQPTRHLSEPSHWRPSLPHTTIRPASSPLLGSEPSSLSVLLRLPPGSESLSSPQTRPARMSKRRYHLTHHWRPWSTT